MEANTAVLHGIENFLPFFFRSLAEIAFKRPEDFDIPLVSCLGRIIAGRLDQFERRFKVFPVYSLDVWLNIGITDIGVGILQ